MALKLNVSTDFGTDFIDAYASILSISVSLKSVSCVRVAFYKDRASALTVPPAHFKECLYHFVYDKSSNDDIMTYCYKHLKENEPDFASAVNVLET